MGSSPPAPGSPFRTPRTYAPRQEQAAGRLDYEEFLDIVASSAPSVGHCNTMGTASTMNALAEALGMSLTGCAAIPAPYRERGQIAYATGRRAVEIVREDLKPSDILTRKAFENAASGDVVLLAPACASFDQFNSYEHRGKVFKELVKQLAKLQVGVSD